MSYCHYVADHPAHRHYHDCEYGFPVVNDDVLFERLVLEINQAGLSWDLMIKKRAAFGRAFTEFSVAKVARFTERDIEQLLNDEGIIRNRRKIEAAIHNAQVIHDIQKEQSFANWLQERVGNEQDLPRLVKLFKRSGFKFVGPLVVEEFLQSVGYLTIPHEPGCPVFAKVRQAREQWGDTAFQIRDTC